MFGFLTGLNLKLIGIIIAIVITFGAGWTTNGWRLNNRYEKEKIAQEEASRKKEIEHQTAVDAIRKSKNEQIEAINTQLYNSLSELHKRPTRPSNALSINGQSGTGRSLFAEDAIFLEREAARADTIRTALDACYKQYDEVIK
jgi:hypothetical protein